jgi:hypothetical protein
MEPLHFTTQDQLKLSDLNKVALEEDANKVTEPYSSQRVDEYKNHFQIIPANDNELKQHCYRIRHDVYCRELGYEPTNQAEIEVDEHDQHSVHCLIRATHSSQFIGCASVVFYS